MNRIILLLCIVLVIGTSAFGQQDPQYSQYMFNGLVLNPAYAGSREQVSTVMIYRNQWSGVDGAPNTASLAIHGPSRDLRHGFGLSLFHDEVGVTTQMTVNLDYAYRIPVGDRGNLSFGLQGAFTHYSIDFSGINTNPSNDPLLAAIDPAFTGEQYSAFRPNVGAGIYFNTDHFYAGFSTPKFLQDNLSDPDTDGLDARRYMHYTATAGIVIDLGKSVKFKPSALMKYQAAAPVQFDLNGSFLFAEKVWIGASYRTMDAVVFIAEFQITKALRLGYSYDLTTSDLNDYNNGSHEIMLGFDFNFDRKGMVSPRYF